MTSTGEDPAHVPGCELCSGGLRDNPWIEVSPEGEGISRVTVDVTLRLCQAHRARLLAALDLADAETIAPSRKMEPWGLR
jgi:hypothetical protein